MRFLSFVLAAAASLSAQQVLVVDINGGAPFTQIQPAIQAASAGDRIEVRPGVYAPFSCSKGVRIFGTVGTVIAETATARAITVTGTAATESCWISNFELRSVTTPCICEPLVSVSQCAGPVILEELWPETGSLEPRANVNASAAVLVRDSFLGPIDAVASEVHLTGVTVAPASTSQGALITLTDSDLALTDGNLRITHACCGFGIDLQNSRARLRVVHGLQLDLGGPGQHDFRADATSVVDYDPGTVFNPVGAPTSWPFGSPGPTTARDLPTVRVLPTAIGGSVRIDVRYAVTPSIVCPLIGGAGPPVTVPGLDGSIVLNPGFNVPLGCVPGGSGAVQFSLPIPNQPAFVGLTFVVQGAAFAGMAITTNAESLRIR